MAKINYFACKPFSRFSDLITMFFFSDRRQKAREHQNNNKQTNKRSCYQILSLYHVLYSLLSRFLIPIPPQKIHEPFGQEAYYIAVYLWEKMGERQGFKLSDRPAVYIWTFLINRLYSWATVEKRELLKSSQAPTASRKAKQTMVI